MNSFVPTMRRVFAVAGAVLAGVAAALAFASPASAHHPIVTGVGACDTATGEWVITWTVSNSQTNLAATVQARSFTPADSAFNGINVGDTIPIKGTGVLTATQRIPASKPPTSLTITGFWDYPPGSNHGDVTQSATGTPEFKSGACVKQAANPDARFATSCTGVVTVTLTNAADATADAKLVVKGKDGWTSPEQVVQPGKEVKVEVPAANSAEVKVFSGDTLVKTGARAVPANCGGLPVTGVKIGAAVAGALGLLSVGGVLLVGARRRRIRFTA